MKILKPGKVEMRKFVCQRCECEFVADDLDITFEYFAPMIKCPKCGTKRQWENGEPYKEPTQTDRGRLTQLLGETRTIHLKSEVADYLIAHGVTFREG